MWIGMKPGRGHERFKSSSSNWTVWCKGLQRELPEQLAEEPLAGHLETLEQLRGQDLEPDPDGGGVRIRQAVAQDRRVSVEDGEMRHGRKSQSKRIERLQTTHRRGDGPGPHRGVHRHPGQSARG